MTKTQRGTIRAVASLLAETGLTQSQFAEMIGASLDAVKSWTRKKHPSPLSKSFRIKIYVATGAVIQPDGSIRTTDGKGVWKPFTKKSFDSWREKCFPTNECAADLYADRGARSIRRIFKAAAVKVNGKQNKLPAIVESFNDWLETTAKNFNLWHQIYPSSKDQPKGN